MLLGFALFWVGAVLFLNGIWLVGGISDNEISVIDIFVGSLCVFVAFYWAVGPDADLASVKNGGMLLLFAFTYYWVAWNRWNNADGRGLGWFCLFVAITTIPIFIEGFMTAETVWNYWLGLNWVAWGVLWFLFFLLLALKMTRITKATGVLCALEGICTGWIPGYLLLSGVLH